MTNLAISAVCNLNCAYCFTSDHLNGAENRKQFMSLDDYEVILDFLDRSDMDEVRLLGGEPTLHPQFTTLVERARERQKRVVVFTNGLMPEKAIVCLEALTTDECFVLMNINTPSDSSPGIHARQRENLRWLGKRAMPGFNIYRPDFDLTFLLDVIPETGCKPSIRLGIAHPCLSGDNRFIHPRQYRFIGVKISRFAQTAASHGIRIEFDCGFVRCMFSDDEFRILQDADTEIGWRCNPILDIDVNGEAIHCYPLSSIGSLPVTADAATLRSTFEEMTAHYLQSGIYPECVVCPLKAAGECPGGCLAATIRRFHHTPFEIKIPHEKIESCEASL